MLLKRLRDTMARADAVEVTLGAAALGRVLVERGLSDGDVIALADPTVAPDRATPTPGGGVSVGGAS